MSPKGGARSSSDDMPTGKGMGLTQHYQTLKALRDLGVACRNGLTVTQVVEEMNKRCAWWDDPKAGGPVETCRSYLKEMWRFGMIDRVDRKGNLQPLNLGNWKVGSGKLYRINERGCTILASPEKCFPYFVAWCIVDAVDKGMHPQCAKLLKLAEKTTFIPVSNANTTKLTKLHGMYVEEHANKAIKFGWLEPTGIIYRRGQGRYKVNIEFIEFLRRTNMGELFAEINTDVNTADLTITVSPPYIGYTDFDRHSALEFVITVTNKTRNTLSVEMDGELSSMLTPIATLENVENCNLKPHEVKTVTVRVVSCAHGVSDSFGKMHVGVLNVRVGGEEKRMYLPTVGFAKRDRVWEKLVIDKLKSLGLYALHLGQSDRPDGVVDLSGIRGGPEHALEYLRDPNCEKMLVETAVGTYKWSKRVEDTQPAGGEGKFERHTSKVLKIQAAGQVVVASAFDDIDIIEARRKHIVTLITMDMLDYMISKREEVGDGYDAVCNILRSNKTISAVDINRAFEEL